MCADLWPYALAYEMVLLCYPFLKLLYHTGNTVGLFGQMSPVPEEKAAGRETEQLVEEATMDG